MHLQGYVSIFTDVYHYDFNDIFFDEVKRYGAKVVMKNNTPECVLLSPEEYIRLLDELNDARLLNCAAERMAHYDPSTTIFQEEVDREFGFAPDDYKNTDEIEFE